MKLSDYEYYRTENGVLYCGDSLEIMPLLKCDECNGDGELMDYNKSDCDMQICSKCKGSGEIKVDLVLTDPPYGIGADEAQRNAAESRIKANGKSKAGRGYKLYEKNGMG